MPVKKNNYIDVELDWAEERLAEWKTYVDRHPLVELTDRMAYKETKNGGVIPTVVASIESQGKFIQETMKNYLLLLGEVNKMREAEEKKKITSRGDQELSPNETGEI